MTNTAELVTGVETAQADIADTRSQAAQAHSCADDLTDSAAAHGWEGVAVSTRAACDALEEVAAGLATADQATGSALTALRAITDQMSSSEVADHLANTVTELDQAATALGAATDSADDAWQAAQRAGEPSELMQMLQYLNDGLDQARRGVDDIKAKTDTERAEATNWGN